MHRRGLACLGMLKLLHYRPGPGPRHHTGPQLGVASYTGLARGQNEEDVIKKGTRVPEATDHDSKLQSQVSKSVAAIASELVHHPFWNLGVTRRVASYVTYY